MLIHRAPTAIKTKTRNERQPSSKSSPHQIPLSIMRRVIGSPSPLSSTSPIPPTYNARPRCILSIAPTSWLKRLPTSHPIFPHSAGASTVQLKFPLPPPPPLPSFPWPNPISRLKYGRTLISNTSSSNRSPLPPSAPLPTTTPKNFAPTLPPSISHTPPASSMTNAINAWPGSSPNGGGAVWPWVAYLWWRTSRVGSLTIRAARESMSLWGRREAECRREERGEDGVRSGGLGVGLVVVDVLAEASLMPLVVVVDDSALVVADAETGGSWEVSDEGTLRQQCIKPMRPQSVPYHISTTRSSTIFAPQRETLHLPHLPRSDHTRAHHENPTTHTHRASKGGRKPTHYSPHPAETKPPSPPH